MSARDRANLLALRASIIARLPTADDVQRDALLDALDWIATRLGA